MHTVGAGGLLDYPHYTRPAEFGGLAVPEVLLNGDHQVIRKWRREQQLRKTLQNRPDLLSGATLSKEDNEMLTKIMQRLPQKSGADKAREKLEKLGITEQDVADAIKWARSEEKQRKKEQNN